MVSPQALHSMHLSAEVSKSRQNPYSQYVLCCVLINHYHMHNTSEKRAASISNTKARGLRLLCCGPLCIFICPPPLQNLLHIKNGHFVCFVNQNQPAHRPPGGAGLSDFQVISKPRDFVWILKRLKILRLFALSIKEPKRQRRRERRRKRGEERTVGGEGTVQREGLWRTGRCIGGCTVLKQRQAGHCCLDCHERAVVTSFRVTFITVFKN